MRIGPATPRVEVAGPMVCRGRVSLAFPIPPRTGTPERDTLPRLVIGRTKCYSLMCVKTLELSVRSSASGRVFSGFSADSARSSYSRYRLPCPIAYA